MVRFNPGACRRSNSPHRTGKRRALLAGAGLACMLLAAHAQDSAAVLRVCADPGNMPLSNNQAEGYENKIAQALARDLGRRIEFTYFPQRMGFVRNTLRQRDESTQQFKCDVIIGVPKGFELTATTRPYMRSTYALLFEVARRIRATAGAGGSARAAAGAAAAHCASVSSAVRPARIGCCAMSCSITPSSTRRRAAIRRKALRT